MQVLLFSRVSIASLSIRSFSYINSRIEFTSSFSKPSLMATPKVLPLNLNCSLSSSFLMTIPRIFCFALITGNSLYLEKRRNLPFEYKHFSKLQKKEDIDKAIAQVEDYLNALYKNEKTC